MMFGRNKGAAETAKRIPADSVGVEIGVWKGDTARLFLKRGLKHLHLVDPWSVEAYRGTGEFGGFVDFLNRYTPLVGSDDPEQFQTYYDIVAEHVKNRFSIEPVTIHRMPSSQFWMYTHSSRDKFDWCYLDGSHAYAEVMNDLMCAGQRVRGSIFGDDYGTKHGVTQAVNDYVDQSGKHLQIFGGDQYEIRDAPF